MTQVKAYTPGLYARAGEQDSEAALREFLSAQREAGMDYFSDGLLFWPDLVAPLAQSVERNPAPQSGALATQKASEPLGEPYFQVREMPRGR